MRPNRASSSVGPYLTKKELEALLAPRRKLLEHFDQKIVRHGEAVVLMDLID